MVIVYISKSKREIQNKIENVESRKDMYLPWKNR